MLYRSTLPTNRRAGVVLLVVMALLSLFATVGLSFVFYADAEAVAASLNAKAQTKDHADVDPEVLAAYFLNQFLYPTNNVDSALRGWELSRSLYGYNPAALNYTPYNGVGRSALSQPVAFPAIGNVDNVNLVNYQQFVIPGWNATTTYVPGNTVLNGGSTYTYIFASPSSGQPTSNTSYWSVQPNDPLAGFLRTPEFFGKVGDANHRYVGGANAPWTAYDTNSLFLAQVRADGTVLMPSYHRPWHAAGGSASRYTSLSPDRAWNPVFANSLIDADGPNLNELCHVRNLDHGPGRLVGVTLYNNDSRWIDMGFPILTAPNGKRYKALFAPLVMDLSNRLHLLAHGNNLGGSTTTFPPHTSNLGLGTNEVSLNPLIAIPIQPPGVGLGNGGASQQPGATRKVIINTLQAHGLQTGQTVQISGVGDNAYNGTFATITVTSAIQFTFTHPTAGLPNSGGGGVYSQPALNELYGANGLLPWRYGAGSPVGTAPNARPGSWFSQVDADGASLGAAPGTNLSSRPFFMPSGIGTTAPITGTLSAIVTPAQAAVPAGATRTVTVNPSTTGVSAGFPWNLGDALQAGMPVLVGGEGVAMQAPINVAAGTFTVVLRQPHAAVSVPIIIDMATGFPIYPATGGWNNAVVGETLNSPLAFNPFARPVPVSLQEALLRHGHTNSPALTSEINVRMMGILSNPRSRNLVTLTNNYLDRVTSAPYLNFNRDGVSQYGFPQGTLHPVLGINEVQIARVSGTAGTFTLKAPGRPDTAQMPYNTTAADVQTKLQATMLAGSTVTVIAAPVNPTTIDYQVSFHGNLSNVNVGFMTGAGQAPVPATVPPTPAPNVNILSLRVGQSNFTPPNYATPGSIVSTNSEFGADARSTLSQRLRVDLTRPLADYPTPVNGLIPTTGAPLTIFNRALGDRQQMAREIYDALIRVTGAKDPNLNAGMNIANPDYRAARWLAQLAANIVDYIDNDDYATPFRWYPGATATANAPEGWVFGTELPRLLLNEAYAQQEPGGNVDVWAEMHNPFRSLTAAAAWAAGTPYTFGARVTNGGNTYVCIAATTGNAPPNTMFWRLEYPLNNGDAILQVGSGVTAHRPYVIEIHSKDATFTNAMLDAANSLGLAPTPLTTQSDWGTNINTQRVLPANGIGSSRVGRQITSATHMGTTVTITTTTPHGLAAADVGKPVTVLGVTAPEYNGTFVLTAVPGTTTLKYIEPSLPAGVPSSIGGTVTYGGNPAGPTFTQAVGFYGIGSTSAPYGATPRNPQILATHLAPVAAGQGMSIPADPTRIKTIANFNKNPMVTGASHAGTTVTIKTTPPFGSGFAAVGDLVTIAGVHTLTAAGTVIPAPAYDGTFRIASIDPAMNPQWFTYTVSAAVAASLPTTPSGSPTMKGAPAATVTRINQQGITLLLRRLANPNLPAQPNPANALYNPYITVDIFDGLPVSQSVGRTFGRLQPYSAFNPQAQTGNSFFTHNTPLVTPFNWLVHLDRPPVNPMELIHVSGYKPHELTLRFMFNGSTGAHYAPWGNPNALIYRFLDQSSSNYQAGLYRGGRFPGNINLNTLLEMEVFQGLCDAHDAPGAQYPNPWFTQADVQIIFNRIMLSRGVLNTAAPMNEGAPFKSFSAAKTIAVPIGPLTSSQVSFDDSWLRADPAGPIFLPPSKSSSNYHPIVQASLLQKIYNNITPTSNCFAVWWTAGYFEVVDETCKPAKLGAEIGRDQNRHVRHRFFAIVDRSAMEMGRMTTTNNPAGTVTVNPANALPQMQTVSLANSVNLIGRPAPTWSNTQAYVPSDVVISTVAPLAAYYCIQAHTNQPVTNTSFWRPVLQPGMLLEIGVPGTTEVVAIKTVPAANQFTADFMMNHGPASPILIRGNPGPQPLYVPRKDTNVVLHLSVIQ